MKIVFWLVFLVLPCFLWGILLWFKKHMNIVNSSLVSKCFQKFNRIRAEWNRVNISNIRWCLSRWICFHLIILNNSDCAICNFLGLFKASSCQYLIQYCFQNLHNFLELSSLLLSDDHIDLFSYWARYDDIKVNQYIHLGKFEAELEMNRWH